MTRESGLPGVSSAVPGAPDFPSHSLASPPRVAAFKVSEEERTIALPPGVWTGRISRIRLQRVQMCLAFGQEGLGPRAARVEGRGAAGGPWVGRMGVEAVCLGPRA